MRVKPRIHRQEDGLWAVDRPAFGFSPRPDSTTHDCWRDAVGSLIQVSQDYASGGQFEQARSHTDGNAPVPHWTPLEY